MNNDVIEQVHLLAPVVGAPSAIERARQRQKLTNAIAAEAMPEIKGASSLQRKQRFARVCVAISMQNGQARRKRLYLAGAAAAIVTAASAAIPLSLSGSAPGPVLRLASYSLRLPTQYHLTAARTSDCDSIVSYRSLGAPTTPDYAASDAAAAAAAGGCVMMVLTPPYTGIDAINSGAQLTHVGPYDAVVSSGSAISTSGDVGTVTTLIVKIPLVDGQTQDLVVAERGLSQSQLLALVANGLSASTGNTRTSSSTGNTGTLIPTVGNTGTSGN